MFLVLDASFFEGVIALVDIEKGIVTKEEKIPLGPLAEEDLAEKLSLFWKGFKSEIKGVALGVGPGSFTGMRVAASLVLPLAFASGLPVITFSSLEGIAPSPKRVATDAKRGHLYFLEDGLTRLIKIEELPPHLPIASPHPLKKIYPSLKDCEIEESTFKCQYLLPLLKKVWKEENFTSPLEIKLNYFQSV